LNEWSPRAEHRAILRKCFFALALVSIPASGCGNDDAESPAAAPSSCGNDRRDTGEACDGADLAGKTCMDFGFYGGELGCAEGCTFDASSCAGRCGDDMINGSEECDGSDMGGLTCQDFDHRGGVLGCRTDCTFEMSACEGDCGDAVINGQESCDGDQLGEATCESLGFLGGTLACNHDCTFDESNCDSCAGRVCDGACVDVSTSVMHCGQCGTRCFAGQQCVNGHCEGHSALSPQQLAQALVNKDFMLINVRVPSAGTIPGTDANVSDEDPDGLADTVGPDPYARVVVYCRTYPRSLNAVEQLDERGYVGISYLAGGVEAWEQAGYQLQ